MKTFSIFIDGDSYAVYNAAINTLLKQAQRDNLVIEKIEFSRTPDKIITLHTK